jgi:hypothetical protein
VCYLRDHVSRLKSLSTGAKDIALYVKKTKLLPTAAEAAGVDLTVKKGVLRVARALTTPAAQALCHDVPRDRIRCR